jgi:hypothetical protein
MNYAKSYLNSKTLAAKIRESAATGKVEKAGGGLASREKRREDAMAAPDFETIRAGYMNMVQDMFRDNIQKRIDSASDSSLMDELTGPSVLGEAVRPERNPMKFAKNYPEIPERDLLAMTIQAEAGGEGYEGMLAVGAVMDNRLKSGKFGNNFKEVLLKPGQFSAWNSVTGYAGGEQGQDMYKIKPSEDAYRVADQLLSGDYTSPVGSATHYVNLGISTPKWAEGVRGLKIGNHTFMTVD